MFLNNPATTKSILTTNNKNATAVHRSKSIGGENGTKRATFNNNNNNAVKTPHRNKDGAVPSKGGPQTTQRRRRALGDISNRKGAAGGGGGGNGVANKGGLVLKQQSSSLKSVKFSKTPSNKSTATKARGGSGVKKGSTSNSTTKSKQRQQQSQGESSTDEYDGVFGVTTRWSNFDIEDERGRSNPLDLFRDEDELDFVDKFREEMWDEERKEREERDRLDDERDERRLEEMIRSVDEQNEKDMEELALRNGDEGIVADLFDQKLLWEEEEEEGGYDPAEERRLSGSDPYSLWGDIDDV